MKCNPMWLLLLIVPGSVGAATDAGVVGHTYPVVERDIRQGMQQLAAGNYQQEQRVLWEKTGHYRPVDLYPLPRTRTDRTFRVELHHTLEHDLKDQQGRVLFGRGYSFNPLDYLRLSIGLVVLDGADPAQIRWFRKSPYYVNHRVKLLLCGGEAREVSLQLQRAVFYLGRDVAELAQLQAVPAVVVQEGRVLQVTEFALTGEENEE